jgi:hypothetical protein
LGLVCPAGLENGRADVVKSIKLNTKQILVKSEMVRVNVGDLTDILFLQERGASNISPSVIKKQ